jgi:hypothetical protein
MLRALCFAKWDRYFYFLGHQWHSVHSPRARNAILPRRRRHTVQQRLGPRLCGASDTTAAPQGRIEINLAAFESRIALTLRGIADKTCSAPDATAIE